MNIRPVTLNDAAQLIEIYSPHVRDTSYSFETEIPELNEFKERIRKYTLTHPWLVCEVEGKVVGYAYGSEHRTRAAYAWSAECTVYIDEASHGKGIGKKLYQELFKRLRAQGFVNVFAGITQPNEASVRLHEAMGFVPIGRFKDVGFKFDQWWDVGWWQLQLQRPDHPRKLLPPELLKD